MFTRARKFYFFLLFAMFAFVHLAVAEQFVCENMFGALKPIIECGKDCLITMPVERSEYFPGNNTTYKSWVYELTLPAGDKEHVVEIVLPQDRESTVGQLMMSISHALMALPEKHITSTKAVRVNMQANANDDYWKSVYKDFTASWGTSGDGNIDLYPSSIADFLEHSESRLNFFRHEHAHNIANKIFGSTEPPLEYKQLAVMDKTAVSEYGQNAWREDFAEAVRVYLQTEGGQKDWIQRVKFKNRFAYLDQLFGIELPKKVPDPTLEARQLLDKAAKDAGQQNLAYQTMKAVFGGLDGAVVKNTATGIMVFIPGTGGAYLLARDWDSITNRKKSNCRATGCAPDPDL